MTLTQAALWTRRGVIGFTLFTVLGLLSLIGYNLWRQYYLANLPPVIEKPEVKFGPLPPLNFPAAKISPSNYSYSIDTVTGGFSEIPKLMKVYFIPKASLSLLASDRAQKLAEKLGFPQGPQILSSTEYRFQDGREGFINIDLLTGNFSFQRTVSTSSAVLADKSLTDQKQVASDFKSYLQSKGLLLQSLDQGRSNVIADDNSQAEKATTKVSLWPADLDDTPLITADFNEGLIRGVITKYPQELDKITNLKYTYWVIDTTTSSTYPLKTAEEAFENLTSGGGFVTLEPTSPKVSITSLYLAYYQSEEYSPYLQPVFVFEGPGFAAIVPAIAPLSTPSVQPTSGK